MQALADRFCIDELNIVSTNGIVIASNLPKVVGDDWQLHPQTAAFLEMFSPTSSLARMSIPRLAQPFRHGTINPEFYCSYFAEAFMDRSGLLQLGYRMDRPYRRHGLFGLQEHPRVRVRTDDGIAYDPLQRRDPDTHLAIEERPVGGLGILMMKKLVDVVTHRRGGEWNILTLVSPILFSGFCYNGDRWPMTFQRVSEWRN